MDAQALFHHTYAVMFHLEHVVCGCILVLTASVSDGWDRQAESSGVQASVEQDQTVAGGAAGSPH